MARGRQRIRQRGSRQQWAQARDYKVFGAGGDESGAEAAASGPPKPLSGADVVASTRCGLCGLVVEQRTRDGRTLVLVPYALCISCDEVRCENCWGAEDDLCGDEDVEHEFLEVRYSEEGAPKTAAFATWGA